jgi:hypothetical protein
MPRRVHRPARVPLGPNRPVLRERRGADDGRGVDAPFAPDFVGAAVGLEGAVAGVVAVVGRVVLVAEVFDHVVFDERVGRPAVEAEVGVTGGGEGAGVVEEPCRRDLVSVEGDVKVICLSVYLHSLAHVTFSYDEVASGRVAPVHGVLAGVAAFPGELRLLVGPVLGREALGLSFDELGGFAFDEDVVWLERAEGWGCYYA